MKTLIDMGFCECTQNAQHRDDVENMTSESNYVLLPHTNIYEVLQNNEGPQQQTFAIFNMFFINNFFKSFPQQYNSYIYIQLLKFIYK